MLSTIALGTMRPRHISLLFSFPSFRTLILPICLSFSNSMQSSCFGNILVRIRATEESEAIRGRPIPRLLDAIFTCGGGEEITVKAREFAFVEISRIPADTPLPPFLLLLSPVPISLLSNPYVSLDPSLFRFQTQFVYLRDNARKSLSPSDLDWLSF